MDIKETHRTHQGKEEELGVSQGNNYLIHLMNGLEKMRKKKIINYIIPKFCVE